MEKKRRGKIVKTSYGRKGIIYDDEQPVGGKLVLHLVDDTEAMLPVLGEDSKQQKILVSTSKVEIIGYVD